MGPDHAPARPFSFSKASLPSMVWAKPGVAARVRAKRLATSERRFMGVVPFKGG
jgi:hypothetical protein